MRANSDSLFRARHRCGPGMSPHPSAPSAKQEGECRLARAVWRHCNPIHVALHTRAERHASASMSLRIRATRDIPRRECRSGSARGATFHPSHVARRAREGRHASPSASPHARVRCDKHRRQCRSTRLPRATCGAEHVARPNRLERHGRPGMSQDPCLMERHSRPRMSPHSTGECDMDTHACRFTKDGEATFTPGARSPEPEALLQDRARSSR